MILAPLQGFVPLEHISRLEEVGELGGHRIPAQGGHCQHLLLSAVESQ